MKTIGLRLFFVLSILAFGIYCLFFLDNLLGTNNNETVILTNDLTQEHNKNNLLELKTIQNRGNETRSLFMKEGLHSLIGQEKDELLAKLGEPKRVDRSSYDYEWWIYPESYADGYLQVGIESDRIVTVYCIGENLPTNPIQIGTEYTEINNILHFQDQVSLNVSQNSYQFKLTEEDLKYRPLVKVDDIFVQLYFDSFTKKLSSIRYLDGATLVKHRPYSVAYRGELLEPKQLNEDEWSEVEKGSSLQIFDITNVIRKRHQLNELAWDEDTAIVAYYHSKDMQINDYFSHTSPEHGELKDRLKTKGIFYQMAAENIAAKYVDSIAAVEGWLNSEGHRVNLLHEEFTHLGVGVFERYYTQNFLTPW